MTQELPHGFRERLDELFSSLRQGTLYLRRLFVHKLVAKEIDVGKITARVSNIVLGDAISVDTINEYTGAAGVTVDSVLLKDGSIIIAGSFAANITAVSSGLTLDATHYVVACDASSAAFTVTLPAASGVTRRVYHIKKVDSSGNTVTVDGNASETIDGDLTKIISAQYDSMQIICDGSNWHIV